MAAAEEQYDLLVVGGGINGAGIACDAAGRGLKVLLCEQDDLGHATSSASSKLIHGGLRYLEHYEFRLVREALAEREILLGKAPHLIQPLEFVLPHSELARSAWLIRVGLFLYDHLSRHRRLPRSRAIDLRCNPEGLPLKARIDAGFTYYDCWVDDARLVVLNAVAAAEAGATILTRTRLVEARRSNDLWWAQLLDRRTGAVRQVAARCLVNATGPWVREVLDRVLGVARNRGIRLVKGSHIVVPRLYQGDHAYILQHSDRRVVFVLPFERRFSLIGTTEINFSGDPDEIEIVPKETRYLCDVVNGYFTEPVSPDDVLWSYAGVRPLFDDAAEDLSAVTRDYVLDLNAPDRQPPLLSVLGGKITTYRRLAEQALDKLAQFLPAMGAPWTAAAPLPGGDMAGGDFERFLDELQGAHPNIEPGLLHGLARRYGTRATAVLGVARAMADLGTNFGAGLYAREVDYLIEREWAETAQDILWRRTKAGLQLDDQARAAVAAYVEARASAA